MMQSHLVILKQLENGMGKLGVRGHKLRTVLKNCAVLKIHFPFFDLDSVSGLVRGKWF